MSRGDDAARGIEAAQRAMIAAANGDDAAVLAAVNEGTHAETAWAAAYLVSALQEMANRLAKGNEAMASRILLAGARNDEDALTARLDVMAQEIKRDNPDMQ